MSARSLAQVPHIDIGRITKLVVRANPKWNVERLREAGEEYLRFLQLCKTYPEHKISAPADIDEFWHAHMLDSANYCRDCEIYFGYYLHHDPCIGNTEDSISAENTLAVYRASFSANPPESWTGLLTCANPGGGCGSIPAH